MMKPLEPIEPRNYIPIQQKVENISKEKNIEEIEELSGKIKELSEQVKIKHDLREVVVSKFSSLPTFLTGLVHQMMNNLHFIPVDYLSEEKKERGLDHEVIIETQVLEQPEKPKQTQTEVPKQQVMIPFQQMEIYHEAIKDKEEYAQLKKIVMSYGGLCDFFCNIILKEDLLGKGNDRDVNFLKDRLNDVDKLNQDWVKKSHIFNVSSYLELGVAFLLGIYPDNIFSIQDQRELIIKDNKSTQINEKILAKGLNKMDDGEVLKVEVFSKKGLNFSGHSCLLKKVKDEEYIWFNPTYGELRKLSFKDLCDETNEVIKQLNATDMYFMKGKDYLLRLENKKIIESTEGVFNYIGKRFGKGMR